jgi:hypothetical protein
VGNVYLLGDVNGTIDWGNGVITGSGGIASKSVALLKFDDTGLALWGQQGGSTVIDIMYDVAVAGDGVVHLVGITSEPFTLGPYTADPINARGTVVARVDPDMSTGVVPAATDGSDLKAVPSLFSTSFTLVCPSLPAGSTVDVSMYDATGALVQRANGLDMELGQGLAPGCYALVVRAGDHLMRTRVVKE